MSKAMALPGANAPFWHLRSNDGSSGFHCEVSGDEGVTAKRQEVISQWKRTFHSRTRHLLPGTSNPYCFSKVIVSGRFRYAIKALAASLCCDERRATTP